MFNNNYTKLPPQHHLAEEILLGGILINPSIIKLVFVELETECFSLETHKIIYRTILDIYIKYENIDCIILINQLWETNVIQKIGGIKKIISLIQQAQVFMPTSANSLNNIIIQYYIRIIKDKYFRRLLIQYSHYIIELAHLKSIPYNITLVKADQYLNSIIKISNQQKKFTVPILLTNVLQDLKSNQNYRLNQGILSGFNSIDLITEGFKNSDLIIIAGRPSMGKTSFSLSIIKNILIQSKKGIIFFSLETPKEQILYKLLSIMSQVPYQKLTSNTLNEKEWKNIQNISLNLMESNLFIDDTVNTSISQISTQAKILKNEHKHIGLIVIDYLQLIDSDYQESRTRAEELATVTRMLKILARTVNIPIIVLSQLNRNLENRVNKKPLLSDLRESGCLHQNTRLEIKNTDSSTNIKYFTWSQKLRNIFNFSDYYIHYMNKQHSYSLNTKEYTIIKLTHNHKILTILGWQKNSNLKYYHSIKYTDRVQHINTIKISTKSNVYDVQINELKHCAGNQQIIVHNSIEQDADLILLMYRPSYYNENSYDYDTTEIIIAKHRNGSTGTAELFFNAETSTFNNK